MALSTCSDSKEQSTTERLAQADWRENVAKEESRGKRLMVEAPGQDPQMCVRGNLGLTEPSGMDLRDCPVHKGPCENSILGPDFHRGYSRKEPGIEIQAPGLSLSAQPWAHTCISLTHHPPTVPAGPVPSIVTMPRKVLCKRWGAMPTRGALQMRPASRFHNFSRKIFFHRKIT